MINMAKRIRKSTDSEKLAAAIFDELQKMLGDAYSLTPDGVYHVHVYNLSQQIDGRGGYVAKLSVPCGDSVLKLRYEDKLLEEFKYLDFLFADPEFFDKVVRCIIARHDPEKFWGWPNNA